MITGVITRWFPDRAFGFIKRDDGERDVFVHLHGFETHSPDTIAEGRTVEFEVLPSEHDKQRAVNVRFTDGKTIV